MISVKPFKDVIMELYVAANEVIVMVFYITLALGEMNVGFERLAVSGQAIKLVIVALSLNLLVGLSGLVKVFMQYINQRKIKTEVSTETSPGKSIRENIRRNSKDIEAIATFQY